MPEFAASRTEVKRAVADILRSVPGVGIVETKRGGVPTWVLRPRELQSFWEVVVVSTDERPAGIGRSVFETITIAAHGFMPWKYANPDTTPVWEDLVGRVQDTLRTFPSLGERVEGVRNTGLAPLRRDDQMPFTGKDGEEVLCHHCLIELRVERYFTYSLETSI